MLTLDVKISPRLDTWAPVKADFLNATGRNLYGSPKTWRTMSGVEKFIDKAMQVYPWLQRENFRIKGTEEERRKPRVREPLGGPKWATQVRVGDIFLNVWGYSMNLVDFYQVTKVSATGKSVNVRKIKTAVVSGDVNSPYGGRVMPVKDSFVGEELKNRRVSGGITPHFKVNESAHASLLEMLDPNGYYECHWGLMTLFRRRSL